MTGRSLQLAFTPKKSLDTKIFLNVTDYSHCLLLFLAASTVGAPVPSASLGSFVYALPHGNSAFNDRQPLSTALYSRSSSVDFATRVARTLAQRLGKPVYVGGEVPFWSAEDEAEGLKGVVEVIKRIVDEEER